MSRLRIHVTPKKAVLRIDGIDIRDFRILCLHSLVRAALDEGEHYMFVCGCGEAGCGGYGPVEVSFEGSRAFWHIDESLDGIERYYTFTRHEVVRAVMEGLESILSHLHDDREDCFYSPSLTSKTRIEEAIAELQLATKKSTEQAGTGQPATRSESDSEGSDKPQPEEEGRSR